MGDFSKALEALVNRISRKAIICAVAMSLLYMLAVSPTVKFMIFIAVLITGLALFVSILQWILDKKALEKDIKIKEIENNKDASTEKKKK